MSKTVDDLIMVFEKARAEAAPFPQHHEDGLYAGIAAVIRALRDDMRYMMINRDSIDDMFDKILGDAGDEVAGVLAVESREGAMISEAPEAPATDPAPAVCEWRVVHSSFGQSFFVSGCFKQHDNIFGGICPSCGKPIKFTEAQR